MMHTAADLLMNFLSATKLSCIVSRPCIMKPTVHHALHRIAQTVLSITYVINLDILSDSCSVVKCTPVCSVTGVLRRVCT